MDSPAGSADPVKDQLDQLLEQIQGTKVSVAPVAGVSKDPVSEPSTPNTSPTPSPSVPGYIPAVSEPAPIVPPTSSSPLASQPAVRPLPSSNTAPPSNIATNPLRPNIPPATTPPLMAKKLALPKMAVAGILVFLVVAIAGGVWYWQSGGMTSGTKKSAMKQGDTKIAESAPINSENPKAGVTEPLKSTGKAVSTSDKDLDNLLNGGAPLVTVYDYLESKHFDSADSIYTLQNPAYYKSGVYGFVKIKKIGAKTVVWSKTPWVNGLESTPAGLFALIGLKIEKDAVVTAQTIATAPVLADYLLITEKDDSKSLLTVKVSDFDFSLSKSQALMIAVTRFVDSPVYKNKERVVLYGSPSKLVKESGTGKWKYEPLE